MIGPSSSSPRSPLSLDERLVLGHLAGLLLLTSWAYGGQIGWVREVATFWSLAGGVLLLRLLRHHGESRASAAWRHLRLLWPLAAATVVVGIGFLYPVFQLGRTALGPVWIEQPVPRWLPVIARPELTGPEFALGFGLVLTAANVMVGLHHRRAIRWLVALLFANAVVLAAVGTLQKLLGLQLYFGAVISPNPSFFATFIYHNHWASFALLGAAAGAALLVQRRARDEADGTQSPSALIVAGLLGLGVTLPLCTSRSGTVLGLCFGLALLAFAARRIARRRSEHRRWWLVGCGVVTGLTLFVTVKIAGPGFERRWAQTVEQFHAASEGRAATIDDRPAVYRATWAMFEARPVFGWGVASYGTAYPLFRRPETAGLHFAHAHSDWLETLAERGVVGTALVLLLAWLPLRRVSWRDLPAFSGWLLAGCVMIAAYAALEFPFANPVVFATWWVLWYAAVRYHQLSLAVDER